MFGHVHLNMCGCGLHVFLLQLIRITSGLSTNKNTTYGGPHCRTSDRDYMDCHVIGYV
jgi:hypothetical protein